MCVWLLDANAKTKLLSNELNTKEQENRQAKKDISQVVAELQSKLTVERDDAKVFASADMSLLCLLHVHVCLCVCMSAYTYVYVSVCVW